MKKSTNFLVSSAVGLGAFSGLLLGTELGVLLAGSSAVATFIGSRFILARAAPAPQIDLGGGITPEVLAETLEKGRVQRREWNRLRYKIQDREIRTILDKMILTMEKIFQHLKKEPGDIKLCDRFLHHHLDAGLSILKNYIELIQSEQSSPDIQAALEKVAPGLDELRMAFEKQLKRLLEDNVENMQVEMEVLENSIKQAGLDSSRPNSEG